MYIWQHARSNENSSPLKKLFLTQVSRIMSEKLSDSGSGVAQLAEALQLSRSQLTRKLLFYAGHPPGKLLQQARLLQAKRLLDTSNDPIKNVAWKCGFREQASFCRAFKKYFKCSPKEYKSLQSHPPSKDTTSWTMPPTKEANFALQQTLDQTPWIKELLQFLVGHLEDDNISLNDIASALHISPSHLNRKLEKTLGVSVMRLLQDIRLLCATSLLQKTDLSIGEVAYRSGFCDQGHLSRNFKATYGRSPSSYFKTKQALPPFPWLLEALTRHMNN